MLFGTGVPSTCVASVVEREYSTGVVGWDQGAFVFNMKVFY